ncbi:MAG TPA: hypothetical protein VIQ53_22400 [Inquilinus sp.]
MLRPVAAVLGLLAILVLGGGDAAAQELTTLALPHPLQPGETAWLEVEVGPVGRREVTVATASGRIIGVISPFGPRAGQTAGVYALPLPAEAIADGRVTIRLTITQASGPPRDPTRQEVPRVTVRVVP